MSETEPDSLAAREKARAAVLPLRVLLVLAVVFSAVAVGSLVLVGVDIAVGRSAGGDVFIAGLNAVMATVFWRWRSRGR
ncbi:hypothetical protein ACFDR8_003856 [Arthrobacter sp. MP_2.3]